MRVTTRITVPVWCLITVLMTAPLWAAEESAIGIGEENAEPSGRPDQRAVSE